MAKSTAVATTKATPISTAIANRPAYLPAVDDDSDINKINQRGAALPTLSINNNVWTLLENGTEVHTFEDDELTFFFLHIHFDTQRRAFEDEWDEDDPQDPICLSNDGLTPIDGSPDPQSEDCATCWRSQEDTKRRDKCSWFRNSIVVVEYTNGSGDEVRCMARLRINGGSLFGEENRSSGEINGESLIRQFKALKGELWYHPVTAFFDTASKGAQNKLLFEVLLEEYPSEELAQAIVEFKGQQDYVALTQLRARPSDNDDESGEEETRETPRQRAPAKKKSGSSKKTSSRSKRSAKKDKAGDDSEGSDTPTRSRSAGKKAANAGGKGRSKRSNAGADDDARQGGEPAEDSGNVQPEGEQGELLNDPDVANLIGDVDLP